MRNINTREKLQKWLDEQRNGGTELTPYQAEQIELAKRRLELAEEKERNRAAEHGGRQAVPQNLHIMFSGWHGEFTEYKTARPL